MWKEILKHTRCLKVFQLQTASHLQISVQLFTQTHFYVLRHKSGVDGEVDQPPGAEQ